MSEYLTDEERIAQLRNWWERNGVALVLGVVLAIGGVVGWRWYQGYTAERIAQASDLYAEFLSTDGAARASLAETIVAGGSATAYPSLVLLHRAREAVDAGELEQAATHLTDAVTVASGRLLADLARLRLAGVLRELGRDEEALRTLGDIRGAGYVAVAQELKGDIHLDRGERTLAYQSYVAALAANPGNDQRSMLEIKVADTADAGGA